LGMSFSRANRAFCVSQAAQKALSEALRFLEKEIAMVTMKINGGTQQGSESLCVTCRWAHIVRGFSASEHQVFCRSLYRHPPVRFLVSQCSSYDDRRLPSKWDMEKIAWVLLTKKAGRSIGFVTPKQFQEIEGDDAEIIPVAAIRSMQTKE
jgi:hypothetical protein